MTWKSPQNALATFALLRSYFSLPKMKYLMRTPTPSTSSQVCWKDFDGVMREALSRILGANLGDQHWTQASLPVSMSGLGIRSAEKHSVAAFLGSISDSTDLMQRILRDFQFDFRLNFATQIYSDAVGKTKTLGIDQVQGCQKQLSNRIDNNSRDRFLAILGQERDQARIGCLCLVNSSDWLNVVTNPALGLHLHPAELQSAVLYCLGFPLLKYGLCCCCSLPSDRYGDHAIACGVSGERIA